MLTIEDLERRFKHHAPQTDKRKRTYESMRARLLGVAGFIRQTVPDGREQELAITKLEEALFWANAGIARSPEPPEGPVPVPETVYGVAPSYQEPTSEGFKSEIPKVA